MGYLNNRGLFHSWKGDFNGHGTEIIPCSLPGDLTDLLYQKWLEIGSVEELEGFYINPETMLRLRKYEKHNQLVLEQIQIEKQLKEEVKKLTDELIQDDLKNQEMFVELLYNNQTKLDSEW